MGLTVVKSTLGLVLFMLAMVARLSWPALNIAHMTLRLIWV